MSLTALSAPATAMHRVARRLLPAVLLACALGACAAPAPDAATQTPSLQSTSPQAASPATESGNAPVGMATAPASATEPTPPAPAPVGKTPPRLKPAPPMSRPLPPQRVPDEPAPDRSASATVKVDTSCRTDADCTVKNVGNCCGEYPACVNVNSPTDPKGVQAACAKGGMMSVCGFPVISGCQCVAGQCQSDGDGEVAR